MYDQKNIPFVVYVDRKTNFFNYMFVLEMQYVFTKVLGKFVYLKVNDELILPLIDEVRNSVE